VVTGGEALYVDLGPLWPQPIRRVWFFLVLPALVINYLGQGALLLTSGSAIKDPFFALAPEWGLYPLIILATMATVIASQAVISGVFSLTNQAIQLGQAPRMNVVQTSPNEIGQIYIPFLNWVMMLTTIALVLGFKSSSNLISAYGISISTAMLITSLLTFFVMSEKWQWPRPAALAIAGLFALIDLSFFSANVVKIEHGGWFSVLVALLVLHADVDLELRTTGGDQPVARLGRPPR
jgi:KUP system potassium uptake protein